MSIRRLLSIQSLIIATSLTLAVILRLLNIVNEALVWVSPVSESLFITGSLVLVYILLSRSLLTEEKFSAVIGISFLSAVIPTFFWFLTWHNVKEQSIIASLESTHFWFIYFRDFIFLFSYLLLSYLTFKIKLSAKPIIIFLLLFSLFASLAFLELQGFLPMLVSNNFFQPINRQVAIIVFGIYLLAILRTVIYYKKTGSSLSTSFSLFLTIYAAGYIFDYFSHTRLDIEWLFEKITNFFAFGALISVLLIEYKDFFIATLVTRSIQDSFKPLIPKLEWLELDAQYLPAVKEAAIGGDWYDIISIDSDKVVLILGDAIGKGIKAISIMAEAKFLLRGYILDGLATDEALKKLNNYLHKYLESYEFATIATIELYKNSDTFKYMLAGHPPPITVNFDGWRELQIPQVRMPLGVQAGTEYPVFESKLHSNDVLCIYSDGLVESRRNSDLFGEKNLGKFLSSNHEKGLNQINAGLLNALQSNWQIVDDLTIILARPLAS